MHVATTAAPPTCDANARSVANAWGTTFIKCNVAVGLRSITDARGDRRYYCAAPVHRNNVERRFGRWTDPCHFCKRDLSNGLFTRWDFGPVGVRNVCDNCLDKADLDSGEDPE